MHPYAIDTDERRNVLIVLVPISFWLSMGFTKLWSLTSLPFPTNYDWIFDPASAVAWFALLYLWMENHGWKWWLPRAIGLVKTPVFEGTWSGELFSSFESEELGIVPFEKPHQIQVEIKQSWSRLVAELSTEKSSSRSDTGSIFVDAGVHPMIAYTYINRPNPEQMESMEMHSGTTLLEMKEDAGIKSLSGSYYNGRGRGNYGTMNLKKC